MTPEEIPAAVKTAGYDGIELRIQPQPIELFGQPIRHTGNVKCYVEPTTAAVTEMRKRCEQVGLEVAGVTFGPDAYHVEAAEEMVALVESAGATRFRLLGGSHRQGQSYRDSFNWTIQLCEAYSTLAAKRGIKTLLALHHGTVAASATQAYLVLSRFDPDAVGCIYDPGNMVAEGYEDYRIGLELLGNYVAHVHLKNARWVSQAKGGPWSLEWTRLEDGFVDLPRVYGALREANYAGWITMSDFSESRDETVMLAHNLGLLRSMYA